MNANINPPWKLRCLATAVIPSQMAPKRKRMLSNEPRKVSRRIGLPEDDSTTEETVYLAVELKIMITDYLEYNELKVLRLVSRDWSSVVTPMLFEHVYISPRREDLEIFNNITRHPVLSTYVKEVAYDISRFQVGISPRAYFNRLCENLKKCFIDRSLSVDWPCDHLVTALKSGGSQNEIYEKHKDDKFVDEGYREWLRHAWYEEWTTRTPWTGTQGILVETLCEGLTRASKVSEFVVTGILWHNHMKETLSLNSNYSGCPSIRNWNALYARPVLDMDTEGIDVAFRIATCALSLAQKVIDLTLCDGISHSRSSSALPSLIQPSTTASTLDNFLHACNRLEILCIEMPTDIHDGHWDSLSFLPKMLKHMRSLQDVVIGASFLSYNQVFPCDGYWPHLTHLEILQLRTGGHELVSLLAKKLPKLKWLDLFSVELVNGSWEGVIEGMRHMTKFNYLSLGEGNVNDLRHHNGEFFMSPRSDSNYTHARFIKDLENYVITGGRHPYLSPDVAPEKSLIFWRRMCPSYGREWIANPFGGQVELCNCE